MKKELPDEISIGHGSGGSMTHDLIRDLFAKAFDNERLNGMSDSSLIGPTQENIAYTTDSYVVDPLFFPGGNIGKLAVCGTVNDLSVAGATPKYLSAGFIIEEGFKMEDLKKIVDSMASEALKAGVEIVTGDTKVVNHGKCDKLFINTSGIGYVSEGNLNISLGKGVKSGDKVIINGPIGDHAIAILSARSEMEIETDVKSDCATLNRMIGDVLKLEHKVKFMRDATRGGLATVLVELAEMSGWEVKIYEDQIPVSSSVSGVCEVFGFDPLYLANEGKVVIVVDPASAESVIDILKTHPEGKGASIIGEITDLQSSRVTLETSIGGLRVVDMLSSDQLPRIC